MEKLWDIIGFGNIVIGVIVTTLFPFMYWFKHPELSQMQVFFEVWPAIVFGLVALAGGLIHFWGDK